MTRAPSPHHHAPRRDRVPAWALILMLAAGPSSWIAQLVLGYGLSSYACYPADTPHLQSPPPGWAYERPLLVSINLVGLALAGVALAAALRAWRLARDEKPGDAGASLEIGEGRTRFLALCAVLASLLFGVAILFNTLMAAAAPTCWGLGR